MTVADLREHRPSVGFQRYDYHGLNKPAPTHTRNFIIYTNEREKLLDNYAIAIRDPAIESKPWHLICKELVLSLRKATHHPKVATSDIAAVLRNLAYGKDINEVASESQVLEPVAIADALHFVADALAHVENTDELTAQLTAQSFLLKLYKYDKGSAPSDAVVSLIKSVFSWISEKNYSVLEAVVRETRVEDLAPELIVGILRTSGHVRDQLRSWEGFLERSYAELNERGYNAEDVLRGLLVGKTSKTAEDSATESR
jgi:hypothetical protein